LAFDDADLTKAYRHAQDLDGLDEVVILSTCNRVEAYGNAPSYHSGFIALKRVLVETRGIGYEELTDPLYAHWERDATDHLFSVAAGLDSMVLGETQIQRQVREALRRAETEGTAGPTLDAAFHAAVRAGRRVRQETGLGAAPDAYVAIGTDLADEALGGIAGRRTVVIGAGGMAELAVHHLRGRGVGPVRVLNRSLEHARALAARTDADHGGLDALPEALEEADLIVSATGAAGHVIARDDLVRAAAGRAGRPLVVLDLAVPRDVEPSAAELDGVRVIDILTLRERLGDDSPQTVADIARAHAIVDDEVRRWVIRRRGDELAPVIRALRSRGDRVVRAELDRWASRLAELTEEERDAVEAIARGVAAKLLHDPIVAMKERNEPGTDRAHAKLLAELFGLDPDDQR
ncbi:MAG: glutamyl-tRNA reductase, partial [Actinobacteria bacterium]